MEAVIKAEGLSREGLGVERSAASPSSRPRSARRIRKKTSAAAPTMSSTRVTAAVAQPKPSDGVCQYVNDNPASEVVTQSHMREGPVPIESRGAEERHQDGSSSQESAKGQFEIAAFAPD